MDPQQKRQKFQQMIPHPVKIEPTINNGLKVMVGCAEFYYTSPRRLLLDLEDYLRHPEDAMREYSVAVEKLERGPVPTAPDAGPIHPVARCACGAHLDGMGRQIPTSGHESPHGTGMGPIPRGAGRLP